MGLIDTKDMMKSGQFKTCSFWQMLWFTRFKGCGIARTLQVPKRNLFGQVSTSRVWIIDARKGRQ